MHSTDEIRSLYETTFSQYTNDTVTTSIAHKLHDRGDLEAEFRKKATLPINEADLEMSMRDAEVTLSYAMNSGNTEMKLLAKRYHRKVITAYNLRRKVIAILNNNALNVKRNPNSKPFACDCASCTKSFQDITSLALHLEKRHPCGLDAGTFTQDDIDEVKELLSANGKSLMKLERKRRMDSKIKAASKNSSKKQKVEAQQQQQQEPQQQQQQQQTCDDDDETAKAVAAITSDSSSIFEPIVEQQRETITENDLCDFLQNQRSVTEMATDAIYANDTADEESTTVFDFQTLKSLDANPLPLPIGSNEQVQEEQQVQQPQQEPPKSTQQPKVISAARRVVKSAGKQPKSIQYVESSSSSSDSDDDDEDEEEDNELVRQRRRLKDFKPPPIPKNKRKAPNDRKLLAVPPLPATFEDSDNEIDVIGDELTTRPGYRRPTVQLNAYDSCDEDDFQEPDSDDCSDDESDGNSNSDDSECEQPPPPPQKKQKPKQESQQPKLKAVKVVVKKVKIPKPTSVSEDEEDVAPKASKKSKIKAVDYNGSYTKHLLDLVQRTPIAQTLNYEHVHLDVHDDLCTKRMRKNDIVDASYFTKQLIIFEEAFNRTYKKPTRMIENLKLWHAKDLSYNDKQNMEKQQVEKANSEIDKRFETERLPGVERNAAEMRKMKNSAHIKPGYTKFHKFCKTLAAANTTDAERVRYMEFNKNIVSRLIGHMIGEKRVPVSNDVLVTIGHIAFAYIQAIGNDLMLDALYSNHRSASRNSLLFRIWKTCRLTPSAAYNPSSARGEITKSLLPSSSRIQNCITSGIFEEVRRLYGSNLTLTEIIDIFERDNPFPLKLIYYIQIDEECLAELGQIYYRLIFNIVEDMYSDGSSPATYTVEELKYFLTFNSPLMDQPMHLLAALSSTFKDSKRFDYKSHKHNCMCNCDIPGGILYNFRALHKTQKTMGMSLKIDEILERREDVKRQKIENSKIKRLANKSKPKSITMGKQMKNKV